MRATIMATGLALMIAGCGGDTRTANNVTTAETDSAGNQLAALPEGQRNAVFIRAIRDAGQTCQHVDSSEQAGEYEGYPVWRAYCDNGASSWTIVVTPGGTAQIINEAEARLVGMNAATPEENGAAAPDQNAQAE